MTSLHSPAATAISGTSRTWAAMSYLSFLVFAPLFLKRNDDFVLGHARQGLLLFVGWIFLLVVGAVPVIGPFIAALGTLFVAVMSILGIAYALRGDGWKMPILGEPAEEMTI